MGKQFATNWDGKLRQLAETVTRLHVHTQQKNLKVHLSVLDIE